MKICLNRYVQKHKMTDLEYGDTFTLNKYPNDVFIRTNQVAAVNLKTGFVLDVDPSQTYCIPIKLRVEEDDESVSSIC